MVSTGTLSIVSLFNLEGTSSDGEDTGNREASADEDGGLAQLGERLPCKQEVSGSIPLISTMRRWANSSAG